MNGSYGWLWARDELKGGLNENGSSRLERDTGFPCDGGEFAGWSVTETSILRSTIRGHHWFVSVAYHLDLRFVHINLRSECELRRQYDQYNWLYHRSPECAGCRFDDWVRYVRWYSIRDRDRWDLRGAASIYSNTNDFILELTFANAASPADPSIACCGGPGLTCGNYEGSNAVYAAGYSETGTDSVWFAQVQNVSPTPLPAALPLLAGGLGALGLLGWRRKRKNTAAIAAA